MKSRQSGSYFGGFPYLLLAALLFFSIFGIRIYIQHQETPQHISREFQKEMHAMESESKSRVESFMMSFDTNSNPEGFHSFAPPGEAKDDGAFFLFVYQNDSLIYWNNNKVVLSPDIDKTKKEATFTCRLKNGWYEFTRVRRKSFLFYGGFLIKSDFPFQNEFVKNQFSSKFSLPASILISEKKDAYPVYSNNGSFLFSLVFDKAQPDTNGWSYMIFLLFILGALCFYYFLYRILSVLFWFQTRGNFLVFFYASLIVLIRVAQGMSGFPAELYQSALFSPAYYSSSSFLPTLGDFTLNSIVLALISLVFYKKYSLKAVRGTALQGIQFIRTTISLFFVLSLFQAIGYFITSLVINSSISLDLQNISGLTFQSGFGLLILTALFFSLWLISVKVFEFVFAFRLKFFWVMSSVIIAAGGYILACLMAGWDIHFMIILFFLGSLVSYGYFNVNERRSLSVQHLLFFLCYYTFFGTCLLNISNQTKETDKLSLLAGKVISRRNPVTEVLYEQLEHRFHADSVLNQWINQESRDNIPSQDSLNNYMKKRYFKDYWKKYQIQITFCDPSKELRIQPQGYFVNCNNYFHEIIQNYGASTSLESLFFLNYGFGKEYYLAILSANGFEQTAKPEAAIFIELNLKNANSGPGYPGLLIDKTRADLPELSDYTYGFFQNGLLIRSVGASNYKMDLKKYKNYSPQKPFFSEDQMVHFQYRISSTDLLLISKKEGDFLSFAMPFSYLFILFAIMALFASAAVHIHGNRHTVPASLRNRLHFSLIGVLVVTLLAIGIVQVINIIQINAKKNLDNLRDRAYSVVVEVQHKYSNNQGMGEGEKTDLEDFLIKLSNVFFTDINVYDDHGMLISSSRPEIFEEGLLSGRMNAMAFQKLVVEKNSVFIHNESIGSMQFNSAYIPFYNGYDKLLGFVNLPYFAKQDESKKEISSFLVTFLNVYILLILFGVFVTVLISNYITAPLAMLAEKMSRLRLGIANEKISWNKNDEIGQLVADYNRMIDELGKSAELLAMSEREGAWREMARQVAHEIKNPLTPMKLSTQYLEKAWNDKAPDWDQRLARFTKTMVAQIDALSVVASDFSDFAKMQTVELARIDMEEVIRFVLSLYQDTTRIQYHFRSDVLKPVILADRSQLIRVFTNLLNNAVQAIGDRDDGVIRIVITKDQGWVVVKISDTGCGISAERTTRIFQPDFTTKTGGMGLGLAIVKGLVEAMNGEIAFTSEELEGTTFTMKFPANEENE